MSWPCYFSLIEPLPRSTFKISRISLLGSPVWDFSRFTRQSDPRQNTSLIADDGIDFYNWAQVSFDLPYIRFNPNGREIDILTSEIERQSSLNNRLELLFDRASQSKKITSGLTENEASHFKVYEASYDQAQPDYETVIRDLDKTTFPRTFYFTVWSGSGDKNKTAKDMFLPVDLYLDVNVIQLVVSTKKGRSVERLQERLYQNLPLRIDQWEENKVNGQFYLFNLEIDKISLLHLITVDNCLRRYFYIDESEKPGALKKRLYLHYRSPGLFGLASKTIARLTFKQKYASGTEIFQLQKETGQETIQLKKDEPYVLFNLFDAPTRSEAEEIINVVSQLFSYYKNSPVEENGQIVMVNWPEQITNFYNAMIPQLSQTLVTGAESILPEEELITPANREQLKSFNKKKLLQKVAPDVFIANYATICFRENQPIPIRSEDIDDWINTTFVHNGVVKQRQVLSYPPKDPKWYFVCPDDKLPFPGIKENKLANKDKYRGLPCCYATDHMDPAANSFYNVWYRDMPGKVKARQAKRYRFKTIRILDPGRFGPLPLNINKLLSIYDEQLEYQRMGLPISKNSFLDCVLLGIGYEPYVQAVTEEAKENLVKSLRSTIANQIRPELLKQENYDQSESMIKADLINIDKFLDPTLYYRAIEEYFEVNIFVFASATSKPKLTGPGLETVKNQLEIPRHKHFYVRTPRLDRPTLIIYKHQPSQERKGVETPAHCELVVRRIPGQPSVWALYDITAGRRMTIGLYQLFYNLSLAVEWTAEFDRPQLDARLILTKSDFRDLFKVIHGARLPFNVNFTITAQIIDDSGKARGFVYNFKRGMMEVNIIAIFPPTQPLNLPLWNGGKLPSYNEVINFLPAAISGVTYADRINLIINGLWYPAYNRNDIIYLPIQPIKINQVLPSTSPRPLDIDSLIRQRSKVNRLRQLNKTNVSIIQLIQWLFVLSGQTVDQFVQTYFAVGQEAGIDSNNIYQTNLLPHRLPLIDSVPEAINFINQFTRGLIKSGKIYLYSNKYYQSLIFYLRDFQKNTEGLVSSKGRQAILPLKILASLSDENDFIQRAHNVILLSQADLSAWLVNKQQETRNNTVLRSSLGRLLADYTNPYLYQETISKSIYLIQNVSSHLSEEEYRLFIPPKIRKRKTELKALPRQIATIQPEIVGQAQASGLPQSPVMSQVTPSATTTSETEVVIPIIDITSLLKSADERLKFEQRINGRIAAAGPSQRGMAEEIRLLRIRLNLAKEIREETVSISRALNVAKKWMENRINLGYSADVINQPYPPYIIYTISSSQLLTVKEDNSRNQPDALQLLAYNSREYGAMLWLSG